MTWSRVLVGVDGSEGSRRALRFAADEARAHDARLTVLTAYTVPTTPVDAGLVQPRWREPEAWRDDAENLVASTISSTLGDDTDLEVTAEVVEGTAAHALIDASSSSDVLVVGTRGHGGFAGMLLGSVSQHVAAHAGCPVVIVR